jgi:hypothetical protein
MHLAISHLIDRFTLRKQTKYCLSPTIHFIQKVIRQLCIFLRLTFHLFLPSVSKPYDDVHSKVIQASVLTT